MKAFRFPLQRVLDWRRAQLDLAQMEIQKSQESLRRVDLAMRELAQADLQACQQVAGAASVDGRDLMALAAYQRSLRNDDLRARTERSKCLAEMARQREEIVQARARFRLVERLRERRWGEWVSAASREWDAAAAEAYLGKWVASRRANELAESGVSSNE